MSRIAAVTVQYGDLPYFAFSSQINRAYCERHEYAWVVAGRTGDTDRHSNWSRIRAVTDVMDRREHDFVLYIDADAWFFDQERRIEDLIAGHMSSETLILIGTDRRDKDFAWSDEDANAGVFVVRNTPLARHVMEEWWHVAIYDKRTTFEWPLEQRAFNWHVRPRWSGDRRINTVSYHHLNGMDGEFIRHAVGFSSGEKLALFRSERDRLCSSASSSSDIIATTP